MNTTIWMNKPAADWLEGLPIGTGRLAAMVLGGVKREQVTLNHEWLWTGRNRLRDTEPRAHLLEPVRELLRQERWEEATQAANDACGGVGGVSGVRNRVDPYQPAAPITATVDGPCRIVYGDRDEVLDTAADEQRRLPSSERWEAKRS